MITIEKWAGLITNASPYAIPPGACVTQTNVQCLKPGQLQGRLGLQAVSNIAGAGRVFSAVRVVAGTKEEIVAQQGSVIAPLRSSAASTGFAASTANPVSLAAAANGNVYVATGAGRGGVIVGGTTFHPIGVPAAQSITATTVTSPLYYFVSGVEVREGGDNYGSPPVCTVSGVTGAKAEMIGDSVASVAFVTSATTHTAAPAVAFSTTQQAANASAQAILRGSVSAVNIGGSAYYSAPPDITVTTTSGVTQIRAARARGVLTFSSLAATSGLLRGAVISDPGLYEWNGVTVAAGSAPLAASVPSAIAGSPSLEVQATAAVTSVTITSAGTGYSTPPIVTFASRGPSSRGSGAAAIASLNGKTSLQAVSMSFNGSDYDGAVAVTLSSPQAQAVASVQPRLSGRMLLGVRFIDRYGNPGDLCSLLTVDCGDGASSITWNLGGVALTDTAPNRLQSLELWRTSGDQAITLYRVATLTAPFTTYTDSLPDQDLTNPDRNGYAELPILTEDGFANANRYGIPPSNMSVVSIFQDRAWYSVDSTGAKPNSIFFSGVDEFEAVPSQNEIIVQNIGRDAEAITGLMPMDSSLYVGQRRNIMRLTVGAEPLTDSSAVLAAQRGMLNDRCWDQYQGVAYIADSLGVYSFDGSSVTPLSDPVASYWTEPGPINFQASKWFFLRFNALEQVVRFYFSIDNAQLPYPDRALCYSLITKAWWLETYGKLLTCGVRLLQDGRHLEYVGSDISGVGRLLRVGTGSDDADTDIQYVFKTGNMLLSDDPKRSVRIQYAPTPHTTNLRLYYNNASSPRASAIASNTGTGFVATAGSTSLTLNMSPSRSSLGTATGFAEASFSGRRDDRSAGSDRHVAIEFAGAYRAIVDNTVEDNVPTFHRLEIEGVA